MHRVAVGNDMLGPEAMGGSQFAGKPQLLRSAGMLLQSLKCETAGSGAANTTDSVRDLQARANRLGDKRRRTRHQYDMIACCLMLPEPVDRRLIPGRR